MVAKNVNASLKGQGGKLDLSLNAGTWTGPLRHRPGQSRRQGHAGWQQGHGFRQARHSRRKSQHDHEGGSYDLGSGKGKFDIDLPDVTFAPGGLQRRTGREPGHTTEDISGTVAAKGPSPDRQERRHVAGGAHAEKSFGQARTDRLAQPELGGGDRPALPLTTGGRPDRLGRTRRCRPAAHQWPGALQDRRRGDAQPGGKAIWR